MSVRKVRIVNGGQGVLVASSNIRKLSTGGKPQQKQWHCPKKQQLFRLIPSFTTGRQLYILKFRHGVRFCSERAVERKDPLVKYGGCDSKSFQIVDEVGRIMTMVACTSMWDSLPNLKNVCTILIPTIRSVWYVPHKYIIHFAIYIFSIWWSSHMIFSIDGVNWWMKWNSGIHSVFSYICMIWFFLSMKHKAEEIWYVSMHLFSMYKSHPCIVRRKKMSDFAPKFDND